MTLPTNQPCSCRGLNPNCTYCGGWGLISDGEPIPVQRSPRSFNGQTEEQRLRESHEQLLRALVDKNAATSAAYAAKVLLEDEEITRAYKTSRAYSVSWCRKCGKMRVGVDGNLFVQSTMNSPCSGCDGLEFR